MAYRNPFWKGIYNLLVGLKVTLRHLFTHAITLQYPTERWTMPERSRGMVVLLSDEETGELNCTACILCQRSCPTGAIHIERHRGDDKKWKLDTFKLDHTICCYCGFCQESCNFDAIKLVPKYEYSSLEKSDLVFDKYRLQEWGRDVEYTRSRPKRKAEPKPAPTPDASTAAASTTGESEPKEETKPEPPAQPDEEK